ncbi:MAG: hypothetical protein NTV73_06665 [Hyphomicrobiales bacterium]|nr:hypothetical protein [Hyphomicrobiales bacterium]
MTDTTPSKPEILQEEIRRQFSSTEMTRFLRSLPAFKIDADVPDRFHDMLSQLDRVERQGGNRPTRLYPRRQEYLPGLPTSADVGW